jgi:orotidine-5'-phosphate decarboxylase
VELLPLPRGSFTSVTHAASRRLIVALDFETLDEAFTFAEKLVGLVGLFKIGKQLSPQPGGCPKIAKLGTEFSSI